MSETTTERRMTLRGLAKVAEIREARYQGRRHIVVPVVALVGDVVVSPLGSEGPEFVPLAVLSIAPGGWNGRPVLPNHPRSIDGTEAASANVPSTLERHCFGQVFNSRIEDGRLKFDVYLDPDKATSVGLDAARIVERCLAKEMVEVSVGALVVAEKRIGHFRGQAYEWVWTSIIPDHLAMLPEDTTGACSIPMGCGAPRAAQAVMTEPTTGGESAPAPKETAMSQTEPPGAAADPATPAVVESEPDPVAVAPTTPVVPAALSAKPKPPTNVVAARFRAALRSILPKAMADAAMGSDPEEQAELIQYETMQMGLTQASDSVAAALQAISAMIAAETTEPTETPEQEDAEETVEMARLESIASFCMAAISSLYTVTSTCYSMRYDMEHADDAEDPTVIVVVDHGYSAGRAKALAGARHSKKDRQTIQDVHDMSVSLGAACTTAKDNASAQPPCGCGKGTDMATNTTDRAAVINRIMGLAASPFKAGANEAANRATLEAFSDDALSALDKSLGATPVAEPAASVAPVATATPAALAAEPAAAAPLITLEAVRAALPEVAAILDERAAHLASKHRSLSGILSKSRPDKWPTPEALKSRTLAELEELASMLPPQTGPADVNYAVLGVPNDFQSPEKDIYANPPTPFLNAVNNQLKAKGVDPIVLPN